MTDGYCYASDPAVGNADGDNDTEFDGPPYADDHSNTLADVAMYYYERDLVSDVYLPDLVPTNPSDSNTRQHMVTYAVGLNVSVSLDPTGPYPDPWPNPTDGSNDKEDRIYDLWHAAVNGRGKYLSVFNAQELIDALLAIKQNIEARTGSAAPVSVNGVELYEEVGPELYMFQSTFNTNGWTGDVKAYRVDPVTGELPETPEWSAANVLDAMLLSNRKIATYNPDTATGILFQYTSLTDTQKTYLNSDETNFLRGDRSLEGSTFRSRFSRLGDIVHSSPVYENGVLYTGANDGMLHAFRATDGSEIFAYVPNLVFVNLNNLAYPDYYDNHAYYVDLSPVIQSRVEISPGDEITLLVGGLGRGGKGYYALDITGIDQTTSFDFEQDVADRVMWEFGGDDDLGYTYSRPAIVNSQAGWIVIVGNGYNSTNGNAVLIILNASDGTELTRIDTGVGSCNGLSTPVSIDVDYDDKVDYVYAGDLTGNLWKFDLTNSDYTKWGVAFGVDSNTNGRIDFADGDDPKPLFQAPGQPITTKPDVMRHPERHGYIVVFGTGKYLRVTDLSDTSLNTIYGIWDYGDDSDDSEYLGFFDRGSATKLSNQPDNVTLLEQEYIPSPVSDPNNPYFWTLAFGSEEVIVRILTDNQPNWETVDDPDTDQLANPGSNADPPNTAHAGWYFDLPLTGERVVSDVIIRDGKAIVITFTPEEAPCSIGGASIIHEMDAATGGRTETGGLPDPQFDIDDSGSIGSGDLINIGTEEAPVWVAPTGIQKTGRLHVPAILRMGTTEMKYFSSSEGTIKRVRERPAKLGVRYWRELE